MTFLSSPASYTLYYTHWGGHESAVVDTAGTKPKLVLARFAAHFHICRDPTLGTVSQKANFAAEVRFSPSLGAVGQLPFQHSHYPSRGKFDSSLRQPAAALTEEHGCTRQGLSLQLSALDAH